MVHPVEVESTLNDALKVRSEASYGYGCIK